LPTHHYGWSQFRAQGASAPDICNVACGITDAWCDMHDHHGVWDYLASVLIAEEAGCAVGEVFGRDLCVLDHTARRGPAVAATPELLDELLAERRRHTPNERP
jgi:fructose-1,6-bisphosphatase/inositol monophosphatase family enzyme